MVDGGLADSIKVSQATGPGFKSPAEPLISEYVHLITQIPLNRMRVGDAVKY